MSTYQDFDHLLSQKTKEQIERQWIFQTLYVHLNIHFPQTKLFNHRICVGWYFSISKWL